jgi:hypothetical protein
MSAAGDVETATADLDDLLEPLVLPPETELPSRVLAKLAAMSARSAAGACA